MAPMIAARAADTEAQRRLPADLALQLADAGLFRMAVPRELGGAEAPPADILAALEILGHADAATGWCAMIAGTTALAAAWLPPAHAVAVFADPRAITGGVFAPMGKAIADGDDYRVTGRWAWASGSANCQWLIGGALIFDAGRLRTLPNGAPDHRMMFMPASDITLIDTWDSMGLRGTGSGDMAASDVRVPQDRSVSFLTDSPRHPGPLYAFPPFGLLALGIAAVASGNALAALDDFRALAVTKKAAGSSRSLAERGTVQAEYARAEASLHAARALAEATVARAWHEAQTGCLTTDIRARLRLAATHLTRTAAEVTRTAYDLAGGTAVYAGHPLQRRLRDAQVATQHMMIAPPTWELTGRVLLGLPTDADAL
ncbi:hydrolase [Polymorphobacter fuscus]|uniref:Hydrolase n=2 Tax=Sandarakinorhabdus fusca TaxID=1439888 RepID=A0A7C9KK12_9SPHN|nr:acyl-CoA dehydrogenase family protein [Polymorphobacter fuscus]KAB7644502.1 hydrolase [Polymorphobacter fuscus]MQT18361.1 hydrolase [Polymorphobacter fuscus]